MHHLIGRNRLVRALPLLRQPSTVVIHILRELRIRKLLPSAEITVVVIHTIGILRLADRITKTILTYKIWNI